MQLEAAKQARRQAQEQEDSASRAYHNANVLCMNTLTSMKKRLNDSLNDTFADFHKVLGCTPTTN